jgi:hypothetical protein
VRICDAFESCCGTEGDVGAVATQESIHGGPADAGPLMGFFHELLATR